MARADDPVVFVVDDEPMVRQMLTTMLGRMFAVRVVPFASAEAALAGASADRPILIVLDLVMPEMDGYRLAELLRATADTAAIPIVAMSGHGRGVAERARRAGCTDFVPKPFTMADLVGVVAPYLSAYQRAGTASST